MTELILGSRCSGKTTELIKRSATDGIYILTATRKQAECLFDQARLMGYNIPFPVTWDEFYKGRFRGSCIRRDGLLIDEAGWLLSYLFNGIPINAVTWTNYGVKDLDKENPNNPFIDDSIVSKADEKDALIAELKTKLAYTNEMLSKAYQIIGEVIER